MWIHGRRAFRPDEQVYRSLRRMRLSRPPQRHRRARKTGGALAGLLAIIALVAWMLLRG
jgi:hypothetical protein